jgi:ribokinase
MSDVAVVGSFNVDHVWRCDTLPHPGETRAGRYSTGPGGKGFNQAVACARAGATTSFVCALGDDIGAQLVRGLAEADDIALVDQRSDLPTGTAGIYVDGQGHNSIVIGAGANGDLRADFVESQWAVIAKARVVLAQCESPLDAVQVALRIGREVGATTLLNPAPANAEVGADLLALTDILTPNETEFVALLTRHCEISLDPDAIVSIDDVALHAHCRRLLPQGTVVVTLGAAGVFVSHAADALRGDAVDAYRVLAFPATPVDTTGAGDAFSGALAASLAQRAAAFAEHVRFAARYAARSTEREGAAEGMPRMLATA